MNNSKVRFASSLFFFLLIASSFFSLYAAESSTLTWSLALFQKTGETAKSLPFARPVALSNGDAIQFFVQTETPAYCYILDETSDGTLVLLYNAFLTAGSKLTLPESAPWWFALTPPAGAERIHVVMSRSPQKKLEKLLSGFKNDGTAPNSKAANTVTDEILKLKRSLSSLAEAPAKPVTIGGTARAIGDNNSYLISQFSGQNTYVKTIRIEH